MNMLYDGVLHLAQILCGRATAVLPIRIKKVSTVTNEENNGRKKS